MTMLVMSPFVIAPQIVGVLFWDHNWISFMAILAFSVVLLVGYVYALRVI
jgi:UDP-GlcNAc:undecaprenyl-phosphate/decaprenyl-phosphate GlcNAc-1-phosphate transferase